MDGYEDSEEMMQKYLEMQNLFDAQVKINDEISTVSEEIITLPEVPQNIEKWTESLPDLNPNSFKLSHFKKMFKINKKYNSLIDLRNNNSQKIKILVIDNLIDRIKDILDK